MDVKKVLESIDTEKIRDFTAKGVKVAGVEIKEVQINDDADMARFERFIERTSEMAKTLPQPSAPEGLPASTLTRGGSPLSVAKEKFILAKTEENLDPLSLKDYETCVRVFIEIVGDKPINHVVDGDIEKFRDSLKLLPREMTKRSEFKGKTALEAISANAAFPEDKRAPAIGQNTKSKYFHFVKTFFHWCKEDKLLWGENLLSQKKWLRQFKKVESSRTQFSDEELEKIFNASSFFGAMTKEPFDYWLPMLCLHTGCRISELTQLNVADVLKDRKSGIWHIYINENDETKNLKSEHAERIIPLHPIIIESGFLDYVDEVRSLGFIKVFPTLNFAKQSKDYSKLPREHFKKYAIAIGIKHEKEDRYDKMYHCFRHNFIDYFKNDLGLGQDRYYEITGHRHKSITEDFYTSRARLSLKKERVDQIDFSFIDWSPFKYDGRFKLRLELAKETEPQTDEKREARAKKSEAHSKAFAERKLRYAKAGREIPE